MIINFIIIIATKHIMHVWYFAYGNDMILKKLVNRIKNAPLIIVPGYVDDYELTFTKKAYDGYYSYANIEPKKGARVWGFLYKIYVGNLRVLDEYNGLGNHYDRNKLNVKICLTSEPTIVHEEVNGTIIAESYIAKKHQIHKNLKPKLEYVNDIINSAKNIFPASYIDYIKSSSGLFDA